MKLAASISSLYAPQQYSTAAASSRQSTLKHEVRPWASNLKEALDVLRLQNFRGRLASSGSRRTATGCSHREDATSKTYCLLTDVAGCWFHVSGAQVQPCSDYTGKSGSRGQRGCRDNLGGLDFL